MLVQALAHLVVRIAQPVEDSAVAAILHLPDGQVAGLEQQRLGGHLVHVEGGEQRLGAAHAVQLRGGDAAPEQGVDEEPRRPGLEPVRLEPARPEQQEDVEGVVDLLLTEPAIAVVPMAYPVTVEARELRREHGVQVPFRVAADGGVRRVQGDVDEVVQAGEDADLGELAHPGEEGELDVRVAGLDGRVQSAQGVAVGAGQLRLRQGVQDGPVVFVHQHRHPLPAALVQRGEQTAEAGRAAGVAGFDAGAFFDGIELRPHVFAQVVRVVEVAGAEVEPHDRMADGPVPAVVDGEAPEQRLVALEQLLARVYEQALAETSRARQEVVLAPVHQPLGVGGLVHVIVALLADLAEGLDPDGQLAPSSWGAP